MNRPLPSPIVAKKQLDPERFRLHCAFFSSARAGFEAVLRSELSNKTVLLPAYIGISTREGSGVFDPIVRSQAPYEFYRLDERLNIRVDDLKARIRRHPNQVLLLIHYFGFKDKNLQVIKDFARRNQVTIVEDFAHAFFTFWKQPAVDFDYGFFSIHKMFPNPDGGFVLSKHSLKAEDAERWNPLEFDMQAIVERRLENYRCLLRLLREVAEQYPVRILRPRLDDHVPQTFPIVLPDTALRDACYFQLNEKGFGVVSLYHSLIPQIDSSYQEEMAVAGRILNLPVHQDASVEGLTRLVRELKALLPARRSKKIRRRH